MAGITPTGLSTSGRRPERPRLPALPESLLRRYRTATSAEIRRCLDRRDLPIYDMMRYHLGLAPHEEASGAAATARPGKMLRPALCLLCCEAVGGDYRRAAPAAAALELLHNFTLIHDDIEDASDARHGRDTVWRLWGQAQAINAGDGMYALAHLALSGLGGTGVNADIALRAGRLLDEACLSLCEGQHLDLAFEERPEVTCEEYLRMVAGKTAALLGTAAAVGSLLGDANEETVTAFGQFGRCLGIAFQIHDDLLGVWGDVRETGKPAADIASRKKSYPVVYALEHASEDDRRALRQAYAHGSPSRAERATAIDVLERAGARRATREASARFRDEAVAMLDGLDLVPARRQNLEAIATHVIERQY